MSPIPTTTWNVTTIDGVEYLVIEVVQFRIPLDWDPSSNMFIAAAAPVGGLGAFPALVQGDTGPPPTLDTINFTALEDNDPTPDSASWLETSPGVWQLTLLLHKGIKGDDGDTILDVDDFGTPLAKKILIVNSTVDGFEYQTQKVGDRYVPAAVASAPSGNPNYTLCSVSIPAQDFDWRPDISGQCIITPTAANVRVDLVARLDAGLGGTPELSGNIVGRSFGLAGSGGFGAATTPRSQVMSAGPPAAASSTYDKVAANTAAVVYMRAERVAGTGTFTTSSDTTYFNVRVRPIP